jgi:hypothetical protein
MVSVAGATTLMYPFKRYTLVDDHVVLTVIRVIGPQVSYIGPTFTIASAFTAASSLNVGSSCWQAVNIPPIARATPAIANPNFNAFFILIFFKLDLVIKN